MKLKLFSVRERFSTVQYAFGKMRRIKIEVLYKKISYIRKSHFTYVNISHMWSIKSLYESMI